MTNSKHSNDFKRNALLQNIKHLEKCLIKANEYLLNDDHAHWHGFRPLFKDKIKDGAIMPPHKDWVENTYVPGKQKALEKAYKSLEILERKLK